MSKTRPARDRVLELQGGRLAEAIATGVWLDEVAGWYKLKRREGERDESLRERIMVERLAEQLETEIWSLELDKRRT